jgi:hypothetical protein
MLTLKLQVTFPSFKPPYSPLWPGGLQLESEHFQELMFPQSRLYAVLILQEKCCLCNVFRGELAKQ